MRIFIVCLSTLVLMVGCGKSDRQRSAEAELTKQLDTWRGGGESSVMPIDLLGKDARLMKYEVVSVDSNGGDSKESIQFRATVNLELENGHRQEHYLMTYLEGANTWTIAEQ